jgi:hypothetical protein
VRVTAVLAAILLTAAACDGGDDPDDHPTTGASETDGASGAPAGLPDVGDGRIVRLLGDGTPQPLLDPEPVAGASVAGPLLVTAGSGGDLVGLQSTFPSLFTVTPDGTAAAVRGDTVFEQIPAAAVAGEESMLLLTDAGDEAALGTISLADGAYTETARLTGGVEGVYTAAVLELPGATQLFWAGTWWTLAGTPGAPTGAEPATPPVDGAVAVARTASGVAVLTATELVLLDESLQETTRTPWALPDDATGQSVTAAVGDGGDGVIVTTAGIDDRRDSGSVLHVTPDGVTVLATGFKPDGTTPSTNCEDADLAVGEAHLSRPVSVTLWEDRIVVADQGCQSLLQLALPAAG